jgi:probable F420-dependent oxidoreductase
MVAHLDALDAVGVPAGRRMLAALGPKMLKLSRDRAAGALPYLVTPEHTAQAREILGEVPLLAPEFKVVLETDPDRARALARTAAATVSWTRFSPGATRTVSAHVSTPSTRRARTTWQSRW